MQDSINEIYETYYKDLYKYAYMLTLNKYDAEDIVQNTFLKAIRGLAGFKGNSTIKTWLFKIVRNECANYYQKYRSNLDIDDVVIVLDNNMDKQLLFKEDVNKIFQFIHSQEEVMKNLLLLRLVDEKAFSEIALILEKSEVWCRVNFFRTKKKMIEELAIKEEI